MLLSQPRSFKIIGNGTNRCFAYEFLFVFHYIYGHILYRFRNKAICLPKIADSIFIARQQICPSVCLSVRPSVRPLLSGIR